MTNKLYEQGHNVIILTATNKHIDAISKYLTSMNLKNRPYNGTKRKIDKDNDRIIVTNNKFSGAGFDMKRLSALIIATPLSGKKSLIQVIGRIVRTCEGKLQPVVIDMIDTDIPELFEQTISYKRSFLEKEFRTLPSTVNVLDLE
jgi:superfamily II DNA or RNA helicase